MALKSTHYRKPGFRVLLSFFVGFGMLTASLVQAAEPLNIMSNDKARAERSDAGDWLHAFWSVDLAEKLQNWKPKVRVDKRGKGLQLAQPFGVRGPVLRLQKAAPDTSGLTSNSRGGNLGASLFLEKRW